MINIGLLGCGAVGSGVVELLQKIKKLLPKELVTRLCLKGAGKR